MFPAPVHPALMQNLQLIAGPNDLHAIPQEELRIGSLGSCKKMFIGKCFKMFWHAIRDSLRTRGFSQLKGSWRLGTQTRLNQPPPM